jgi:hypothetical protein
MFPFFLKDPDTDCFKTNSILKFKSLNQKDRANILNQLSNKQISLSDFRLECFQLTVRYQIMIALAKCLYEDGIIKTNSEEAIYVSIHYAFDTHSVFCSIHSLLFDSQEALSYTDIKNKRIDGRDVFKQHIVGMIVQFSATQTNVAATLETLAPLFTRTNQTFVNLLLSVTALIKDARTSNGEVIAKDLRRTTGQPLPARAMVANPPLDLFGSGNIQVKEIDHFICGENDGLFYPVLSKTAPCPYYRQHFGKCIEVIDSEATNHSGFKVHFAYLDVPWGFHDGRTEDSETFSSEEVKTCIVVL